MKRRILLIPLVLLLAISMAIGCPPVEEVVEVVPQPEVFEWIFVGEHPSGHIYHRWMEAVAERVYISSGGRLKIEVFGAGEIVPAYEIHYAIRDGVANLGWGSPAMWRGYIGDVGFLLSGSGVPGGPHPIEWLAWWYAGGGAEIAREIMNPFGYAITPVFATAEIFAHAHKPITSLEDFEGLKFRTWGLWATLLAEELGVSVVTLPGGEIYMAAAAGIIDAFEFIGPAGNWPMGFHEITQYLMVPGIHSPGWQAMIVAHHDSWNALPADLRAILTAEIRAQTHLGLIPAWYADAAAMDKYREFGTTVVHLDREFQEEIARVGAMFIYEMALEDPLMMEVLIHMRDFFATWRGVTEEVQPEIIFFDYLPELPE
jgi:TRAP-type mannitol/chloroaromatic compound transport system substrate-binding protein